VNANITLSATTVYAASRTIISTKTIVPQRVTRTTTKTITTINAGKPSVKVVKSTKIVTPTCTIPPRQPTRDPKIRFKLRLSGPHAAQIQAILAKVAPAFITAPTSPSIASSGGSSSGPSNAHRFRKWKFNGRSIEFDKNAFVQARNERMGAANVHLAKRTPEEPTITVNATDTTVYPT
jgi:hypothetical protein